MRGGDISTGIKCGRSLGPAGVILGSDMALLPPTDLSLCATGAGAAGVITMRSEVTNLFRTYSESNRNSSRIIRTFSATSWLSSPLKWSNSRTSRSIRSMSRVISRVTVSVLVTSVSASVTSVVRIEGLLVLGVSMLTLIDGAGDGGRGITTGSTYTYSVPVLTVVDNKVGSVDMSEAGGTSGKETTS